jgi:hypothetical protein
VRLVAAHVLFTLSYLLVLLGLPRLYGAESVRMGRLGLVGFLVAFTGTALVVGQNARPRPGFSTEAVQPAARVNVTCVTPPGEEVASTW